MEVSAQALARAARAAARPLAPEVARVVAAQQAHLAPSPLRDAHLRALAAGAAAVVTGQQVGLFLGPLYTLYKAASAIVLARRIAEAASVPVVPVFWLQTEDHDLPEIASAGMIGETIAVGVDASNRRSIAHLALPSEVESCVDRVAALLGDGPHAREHVARLRRHYRANVRWADAFAGVLGELFAPEGLVIVDPRDRTLAAHVAPVHRRAVHEAATLAAALVERAHELRASGRPVPVHVRPDAPLSFYHPQGATGPRVRSPDVTELAALDRDPLQFSTSALLRPIVQDTLLPTVAYVGGPAEVAYAAQTTPLYRAFERVQPAVVRRASFRIVDVRMRALLDRLGLSADDASQPEEALLARLRRPESSRDAIVQALYAPFAERLSAIEAVHREPRAFARTRATVERAIDKLARKLERTALYEDAELVTAVRRVRATLAPGGAPQERVLCLSAFAAREGDRTLVERVLGALDPFAPAMKELS